MTERSYQDAVQVLRDTIGGRWDGGEEEGRDAMTRLLEKHLGLSSADANRTVDEIIHSGRIRYQYGGDISPDTITAESKGAPILTGPQVTGAGLPAAPVAPGDQFSTGYWEIGVDDSYEGSGRKGQVTPR